MPVTPIAYASYRWRSGDMPGQWGGWNKRLGTQGYVEHARRDYGFVIATYAAPAQRCSPSKRSSTSRHFNRNGANLLSGRFIPERGSFA
jgi:hypothetical protein